MNNHEHNNILEEYESLKQKYNNLKRVAQELADQQDWFMTLNDLDDEDQYESYMELRRNVIDNGLIINF